MGAVTVSLKGMSLILELGAEGTEGDSATGAVESARYQSH